MTVGNDTGDGCVERLEFSEVMARHDGLYPVACAFAGELAEYGASRHRGKCGATGLPWKVSTAPDSETFTTCAAMQRLSCTLSSTESSALSTAAN
eukprot:scaffold1860_cov403-Prasinococcus_capsulatus_cf.AAC.19